MQLVTEVASEVSGWPFASEIGRTLAEMDLGCPPPVTAALSQAVANGELGYVTAADTEQLQRAVSSWLSEIYRWEPPSTAIRPVADLVAGFRAVLTHLLPAGQPIIVPTPGYMPFLSMPGQIDHPVIEVPMLRTGDGWQYDFVALRAAFEAGARLLVLCNPHNPIGKVSVESELAEIEDLVSEYDGIVFSDEIHAPLVIAQRPHIVYAARNARAAAHTITATSATKAFNIPGAKCGQLIFTNPEHLAQWHRIGHWHEHQTSVLGVIATAAAYDHSRDWLAETVETLRGTVAEALALLTDSADRTGIRVIGPDATYLLWLDLTDTGLLQPGLTSAESVRAAAGLIVTDGEQCGEAGRGAVRFNAALARADTATAMRRLVAAATAARASGR